MEAVEMITDLSERMSQWRQGELSNGEILRYLLIAQCEVCSSIAAREEVIAEQRVVRLFDQR